MVVLVATITKHRQVFDKLPATANIRSMVNTEPMDTLAQFTPVTRPDIIKATMIRLMLRRLASSASAL